MSVSRTIAKNTLFNFIANASDQLINLGTGILLARYLGPNDYGLLSFLTWFLLLGVYFSNLGLGYMLERFVAEALGQGDIKNARNYSNVAIWLRVIAGVVVAAIIALFAGYWSKIFGHPGSQFLFVLTGVSLLPYVLNFILTSVFAGFQKYEYGAYLILATNPLRAIGMIAIAIMGGGVKEIISVNIGAWVIGVFVGLFLLRRLIPINSLVSRPEFNPKLKTALKYSMVMLGILFVNYFLRQRAETLFLGMFQSSESVGFYTIAFLVPTSTVGLLLLVFSQVLVPAVSQQFGRGDIERIREIYVTSARYLMMIGIPLAVGGIILAGPIITLIYGAEYAPVIPLMQVLFIPFAVMGIADAAVSVIFGMNQPSFILKVGVILAILNVGLTFWLIKVYGVMGAAIGSSIPRLIAPVFYIRFASRKCGVSWPMSDALKITGASIIMGAAVFGLQYYITRPIFSLLLLVPLGLVMEVVGLIIFNVVQEGDINIFKRIRNSLPSRIRGIYGAFMGGAESLVKWRRGASSAK